MCACALCSRHAWRLSALTVGSCVSKSGAYSRSVEVHAHAPGLTQTGRSHGEPRVCSSACSCCQRGTQRRQSGLTAKRKVTPRGGKRDAIHTIRSRCAVSSDAIHSWRARVCCTTRPALCSAFGPALGRQEGALTKENDVNGRTLVHGSRSDQGSVRAPHVL